MEVHVIMSSKELFFISIVVLLMVGGLVYLKPSMVVTAVVVCTLMLVCVTMLVMEYRR